MKRFCLYCQEPISGRVDKKFCSDQCRNTFNNEKNAISETHIRQINSILRKNRKLLEEQSGQINKKIITLNTIAIAGFNFNYYTSTFTNKRGQTYFFCYEYGYLKLGTDKLMIVKREHTD